jgi:tetratricopeptide (TPR) repeat protein
MESVKDTQWLVKSDGEVFGPFAYSELVDAIRLRRFRPTDEASVPGSRWTFIRDEPLFAKAVEQARHATLSQSDDTTRDVSAMTQSRTVDITLTQSQSGPSDDDRTEEIAISTVQEALYGGGDRRGGSATSVSYSYESDPRVQAAAQSSTRWLMVLTVVLVFLTAGYVLFNRFVARPIQERSSLEQHMVEGRRAYDLGDYESALKAWRLVRETNPDDRQILLPLALLEIQVGQQTVVAKKLLDAYLKLPNVDRRQGLNAQGLAALKDGQIAEAQALFQQALDLDSGFVPAILNLGAAAVLEKEWSAANGFLQLAIKNGGGDGYESLLLSQALLQQWAATKDKSYLQEALDVLERGARKEDPYLQGRRVALAYVRSLLGQKDLAENRILDFAEVPLNWQKLFRMDLQMAHDGLSWSVVKQWCLTVVSQIDPKAGLVATEAKCLFLAGDLLEASRKIELALGQEPRNPLVQAIYADLLLSMNDAEKAKVAIEKAVDFDKDEKHLLPLLLQARTCEGQRDFLCSTTYWKKLFDRQGESLLAQAGLARSFWSDGKFDEGRRFFTMTKVNGEQFIPMLELKKEIEAHDAKIAP